MKQDYTVLSVSFGFIFFSLATSLAFLGDSRLWAAEEFPKNATVTTLITTPRGIEGLTGDNHSNLYTSGWGTPPCPVWQINIQNPSLTPVGFVVPAAGNCILLGIAFDHTGALFIADGAAGVIYTLQPNAANPPNATVFASGVPGANSIAIDKRGNLWVSDGATGLGRVWKIIGPQANCTSTPAVNCEDVFRVQPMANDVVNVGGIGGVGRDVRGLPLGTINLASRFAANTEGSTQIVANGLAFDRAGNQLFIADTARGAIWRATFSRDGLLTSTTGCDTTFSPATLCLENVFVAHPFLEGADGIALDRGGNIWVVAFERQAVLVVTKNGKVIEVFRNPVNSQNGVGLRNAGNQSVGNNHILESPTSPFITGKLFCTAQDDSGRRDNSPRREGEVSGGQPQDGPVPLAKISCMDQELRLPGLRLPLD